MHSQGGDRRLGDIVYPIGRCFQLRLGQVEWCEKSCIGLAVLWNSFDITVEIPFPGIVGSLTRCMNGLVVLANEDESPGNTQGAFDGVKLLECTFEQ